MAISDFLFFIIIQGIMQIIIGVMMLNYASLMITISNNGKYKTLTYQCFKIAYALSCVIFIPFGTYLSAFVPIETLILIAGMLSTLALAPLILLQVKPKKKSF